MTIDVMDGPLDGQLLVQASDNGEYLPEPRNPLQQVKTAYTTAIAVQKPRELAVVHKRLMAEAKLGGESFYYGWGAGKDRVEGPSIGLAMAAVRCFGNTAVDVLPIQETDDSWVVTSVFVDLETGFTLSRPFRQSKKWNVHGKMDAERKDDVRFQIGASKSARNVVCNALPKWLVDAAVTEAKQGVREKIEKYVKANGLAAAVTLVLNGLQKHGVTEPIVIDKCQVGNMQGLTIDHVVMLRGDLYALDNGQDYASALFPAMAADNGGNKVKPSKVNDKLKEPAAGKPPSKDAPPDPKRPSEMTDEELKDASLFDQGK